MRAAGALPPRRLPEASAAIGLGGGGAGPSSHCARAQLGPGLLVPGRSQGQFQVGLLVSQSLLPLGTLG